VIELSAAAIAAAFAAGFVSFISPCVLPLVPGYLSLVSGVSLDELSERPRKVVATTAAFVAGFAAMFIAFGAGVTWLGDSLTANRRLLEVVAGAFVVFAGLVFLGARLPVRLYTQKRVPLRPRGGPLTSVLAGVSFAVGWTPCVGPTLAAILALSAAGSTPEQGAVLLGVYALGLGLPFLLFGLTFTRMLAASRILRRHRSAIAYGAGGMLVLFGILLATGQLLRLTSALARFTEWQI